MTAEHIHSLRTHATELAVLRSAEVVVVGGSFAGVAAARACAQTGLRTLLIESRTCLGREVTATLRPWIVPPANDVTGLWRALWARLNLPTPRPGKEIPLHPDALKRSLEDLLLEAGIDLLYATQPVGVLAGEDCVEALVVGNKSGRQLIRATTVIDASETAIVVRLAGADFEDLEGRSARYARTLEFDSVLGLEPLPSRLDSMPQSLLSDLGIESVELHQGYRGDAHVLVECVMELPASDGLDAFMARELAARHRTMLLASRLIQEVPGFGEASLAAASWELHGPLAARLRSPVPNWIGELVSEPPWSQLSAFAGPVAGLWCLGEAARLPAEKAGGGVISGASFRDPIAAAAWGEYLAVRVREHGAAGPVQEDATTSWPRTNHEQRTTGYPAGAAGLGAAKRAAKSEQRLTLHELPSPQRGRPYPRLSVPPQEIPVAREADVLVVGGGTSGATAAVTAARGGANTVLLEMHPGLGGTGTVGGVNSYWYGRDAGFSHAVRRWTEDIHASLGHSRATWNIEAKMYALLREATAAKVGVFFRCAAIGAVVEDRRVRGVIAATPWGPRAFLAEVVIDATGDGDVAASAGAEFVYGAERDHSTMWFSLAQFVTLGRTRNNFTSTVDVSNVEDYTRALLAGRRRGSETHDHGIYLAPRESRHILGEVVLTHTDQLARRAWPDVVNIHYSNHDVKGITTSPWVRMGLIPPNLEIEVPYRALIPRSLDGILVAGKAISADHDSLPAIRMQADMENLGGVAGLAAAMAVCAKVSPRNLEVSCLQRRLVQEGVLPERVLTRPVPVAREPTDCELRRTVDAVAGDKPLHAYSDMDMGEIFEGRIPFVDVCLAGPRIVPFLEQALAGASGLRRVHLAQALAFHGSPAAVSVLIEEIESALSGGRLPVRESKIRHAGFPPDQGAMPDLVYLLFSLGMARDRRSLAVWERIVDLLEPTEAGIRDRRTGTFHYVEAVCWGAEQLGDPGAVPLLLKLHSHPALRNQTAQNGFQPDSFFERQAMLELAIGRALARCGADQGIRILISYLGDARALLAEQAHSHLIEITGSDYGKVPAAWLAALER